MQPKLYESFIDGGTNALNVPALADLPEMMNVPEEFWPKPNLAVMPFDITYEPARPEPVKP